MSQPQIEYYKLRDFGQKFNATIEFIRWNFKSLALLVLVIALPATVIIGFLFTGFMQDIFELSESNPQPDEFMFLALFGAMGVNYLLMILVSIIASSFIVAAVYTYMRLLPETDGTPEMGTVLSEAFKKVPGLILLTIIVGLISAVGFAFFILPGIYLTVVFLISVPVFLFENASIGDAISRPFQLIKGKWWSTLGIFFITTLTAQMIAGMFVLPSYLLFIFEMFRMEEAGDFPDNPMELFSSWWLVTTVALAVIGAYVTRLLPLIAVGFQYFNLKERTEGTGLKSEIEDFESIS